MDPTILLRHIPQLGSIGVSGLTRLDYEGLDGPLSAVEDLGAPTPCSGKALGRNPHDPPGVLPNSQTPKD